MPHGRLAHQDDEPRRAEGIGGELRRRGRALVHDDEDLPSKFGWSGVIRMRRSPASWTLRQNALTDQPVHGVRAVSSSVDGSRS